MFGIVCGLFAFNGLLQRYAPSKALVLPKGAYIFLTAWLVAGFTPIFEVLLGVQMGNGAHLGGALAGLALAYFYCLKLKREQIALIEQGQPAQKGNKTKRGTND